jgi:BON domain-containing protein
MDPIKTAVKYALIPLRTVVQLGELYLGEEEQPPPPPAAKPEPAKRPKAQARPRRTAKPSPQASQRPKDLDDVALARKVETIIFRDDAVPKGKIDVNAADGVVWIRGEAKTPEMINALERECAAIPEVRKVENLLHLPKTPAPTRTVTGLTTGNGSST